MKEVNIIRVIIISVIFCFLGFLSIYFLPPFFITKSGQYCLNDYHCSNINCEQGETYQCNQFNECVCSMKAGGFLLSKPTTNTKTTQDKHSQNNKKNDHCKSLNDDNCEIDYSCENNSDCADCCTGQCVNYEWNNKLGPQTECKCSFNCACINNKCINK